jgi:hypothetical protein
MWDVLNLKLASLKVKKFMINEQMRQNGIGEDKNKDFFVTLIKEDELRETN